MTIYLDYQATTPLAPEAAAAMRPWLEEKFANPHSPHRLGREAAAAVEVARERVRNALIPHPAEFHQYADTMREQFEKEYDEKAAIAAVSTGRIFFTGSATEAANWALKGSFARLSRETGRKRIVTIATEHACVLDTVEALGREGAEVVILPVRRDGTLDLDRALEAIDTSTAIVAAMLVNNEIGIIGEIEALGRRAREVGAVMFCDAVQGYGRLTMPVEQCDLVAVSAHKIHGPKGIGALWVREGQEPDVLIHGGGQEGGLRSGTLSPALCVGFGEAARIARNRAAEDLEHVDRLHRTAHQIFGDGWEINGSCLNGYRGNLNIRAGGVDAARLISEVRDVAFSAGSACASGSGRPSHVLRAIGLNDKAARSSIRLGFGRYTTMEELVEGVQRIFGAAEQQRMLAHAPSSLRLG